jgi:hypothetical protein
MAAQEMTRGRTGRAFGWRESPWWVPGTCQILGSHQVTVGLLGLLGNVLCIVYFSGLCPSVKKNFHNLMLACAVCDFVYIFNAIFLFAVPHLVPRSEPRDNIFY